MDKNLIKKIDLENGLELEFFDCSKKIAGDRWQVKLLGKIEIPVSNYLQGIDKGIDTDDVLEVLGQTVIFEKNRERNFIDDKEKEKLLNDFCESLKKNALSYLSTLNFPQKFIVKKYREKKASDKYYQS